MPTSEREQLVVSEAASLVGIAEGTNATQDGTVLLHLMRPCLGKGKGRHIYEADMLQREANAGRFDNWPMFVDHQSPAAKRQAEGLPRSLRDAGGRVVRTWWDPTVEADTSKGFGPGAVMAEVKPVPWVHELIEHDPALVNVSLNTHATSVTPRRTGGGKTGWVVEGFVDEGSADWVTKPGAGGRVVELLEAEMENVEEDPDGSVLEAVTDDALADHIRTHRPALVEALQTPLPGSGEEAEMDDAQIQEATLESLRSDEGKAVMQEVVREAVEETTREALKEVLPGAIAAASEVIQQEARDGATHAVRMGRLSERASASITEAKLPEKFEKHVKAKFESVDLQDKVDDEGEVTESAEAQLDALVEAEISEARELVGSISPTSVGGQGGGGSSEAGDVVEATGGKAYRDEILEAGVDFHEAWGIPREDERKDPEKKPDPDPAEAAA